jgi:hypothetical protein
VKFTLPLPPNMANGRMHWRAKYEAQKSWAARAIVAEPQLRGRHDVVPRAVVTAVLYVHQAMDDDNAVARIKWCLDLLVKRGILAGDKRPQCQLAGIPDQFVDRKNPRVELTVEPATTL